MKKKLLSLALALVVCLGLLPTAAFAANTDLPDWYFLFAIFKNVDADGKDKDGKAVHVTYSMSQDEIDYVKGITPGFEEYMSAIGVMRAHVDVVEIDTTVTELNNTYSGGSWLSVKQAEPILKDKVDLDQYDHVFCVTSLNDLHTNYLGLTGANFSNFTGHTCINLKNRDYCLNTLGSTESKFPASMYVHEFLHFMAQLCGKWGEESVYDLHKAGDTYNTRNVDNWKGYYTDIILNRATGGFGTGVVPVAWKYPPRVLRTMTELTAPSGIATIGDRAFWGCTTLTKVTIPTSVTSIGYASFWDTGVKDVYYGGTEAQWKTIKIGEYNGPLTKAKIHYNSAGPGSQATTPVQPEKPIEQPQRPAGTTASPTNDRLEVNGTAANPTVYKIGGSNYFKIRDVAALLNGTEKQFAVGYDGEKNAVTATTGQGYDKQSGDLAGAPAGGDQSAAASNDAVYVNGEKITAEVYKIGGSNYFKLRDLGKALDFYVGWSAQRGMYIETGRPYSE